MSDFRIVTDTASDLPSSYCKEHDIAVCYLSTIIDGITYNNLNPINIKDFYDEIRNGKMPTTSQVNPEDCKATLLEELEKSKNILVLAFSSGLSGTCQSFNIAAEEIMEENSDANIVVIDTLCASLGQGLIVHKAIELRDKGESFENTIKWVKENIDHVGHVFTVDDLFHLFRGGRVSKTSAVIGSMINIKPLLHVNDEGRLINLAKCRGRKKSLLTLVDMMADRVGDYKNDIVFISHSDCLEDAQFVADEVKKRFGVESVFIDYIGSVIGSHTGLGTVALFFMADHR